MISKSRTTLHLMILMLIFMGQSCGPVTPITPAEAVLPKETSALSETPTAIKIVTPSMTVLLPTETQELRNDQPDLSRMHVDEWVSTSPDATWIATGLVALPKGGDGPQLAYVRLIIFSADGNTRWAIIDEWQEVGLGFPSPAPLKWSQDGSYFYFSHRVIPDGCSVFATLSGVQQVDLQNGSVQELLPLTGLGLALAPDESKAAYISDGERRLVLRDLISGEERETEINPGRDYQAGNIQWSPDGKSLVLTLAIEPCMGDYDPANTVWAKSTTVLWVEAETLGKKILLEEDPRLFVSVAWNQSDTITLKDENGLWYLHVDTGEITQQ